MCLSSIFHISFYVIQMLRTQRDSLSHTDAAKTLPIRAGPLEELAGHWATKMPPLGEPTTSFRTTLTPLSSIQDITNANKKHLSSSLFFSLNSCIKFLRFFIGVGPFFSVRCITWGSLIWQLSTDFPQLLRHIQSHSPSVLLNYRHDYSQNDTVW